MNGIFYKKVSTFTQAGYAKCTLSIYNGCLFDVLKYISRKHFFRRFLQGGPGKGYKK